jgi:DNA-binding FadR family transcriptional regulator
VSVIAYSNRGLGGQIVEDLGRRIVQGELPPGSTIDVDQLESQHAVSRTVVREAVKVLIAKGLLDARPKRGTFVRSRTQWNLLDADVMSWRDDGQEPDPQLLSDLAEVRGAVEPQAARLAAERRTPTTWSRWRRRSRTCATARTTSRATWPPTCASTGPCWRRATTSCSVRLEVVLEPALRARDRLAFAHRHGSGFLEAHTAVFDAVRQRIPTRPRPPCGACSPRRRRTRAPASTAGTAIGRLRPLTDPCGSSVVMIVLDDQDPSGPPRRASVE